MTIRRERKFEKINNDLFAMSKVVFKQLELIREQLEGKDFPSREDDLTQNELILDSLEVKIRKNVINAIILYGPRASDLRKIISCYDMTSSLERIGDLVLNVNGYLNKVDYNGSIFKSLYEKFHALLSVSEEMTRNAIYSFSSEDIQLTKTTIDLDDTADDLHREIGEQLVEMSTDSILKQQQVIDLLSLSSLSYNLERIADNATNIAEAAVYVIEGKNIQHLKSHNEDND